MQNKKLDWQKLLCSDRIHGYQDDDGRTPFERDYDKVIFSSYFRRLQNKTQLFPLPKSDYIHNRLTHSLEVSSVGRSLGILLKNYLIDHKHIEAKIAEYIPTIVSAACLFHDIGNPAFGHSGEKAISRYFKKNKNKLIKLGVGPMLIEELSSFEGNAQAFRIINFEPDLNLTYAVTASFIKYPRTFVNKTSVFKKYGIGSSEYKKFEEIFQTLDLINSDQKYIRHPLAFLVEAADDICYKILDLEDTYKIKLLDYENAKEILTSIIKLHDNNAGFDSNLIPNIRSEEKKVAFLRARAINSLINIVIDQFKKHYDEILMGSYNKLLKDHKLLSLIEETYSNTQEHALQKLKTVTEKLAYNFPPVLKIELTGFEILSFFLNIFINSVIYKYYANNKSLAQINIDHESWERIKAEEDYAEKIVKLISTDYLNYELSSGAFGSAYNLTLDEAILKIVDFVAGMTDIHAIKLYKRIKGMDLLR